MDWKKIFLVLGMILVILMDVPMVYASSQNGGTESKGVFGSIGGFFSGIGSGVASIFTRDEEKRIVSQARRQAAAELKAAQAAARRERALLEARRIHAQNQERLADIRRATAQDAHETQMRELSSREYVARTDQEIRELQAIIRAEGINSETRIRTMTAETDSRIKEMMEAAQNEEERAAAEIEAKRLMEDTEAEVARIRNRLEIKKNHADVESRITEMMNEAKNDEERVEAEIKAKQLRDEARLKSANPINQEKINKIRSDARNEVERINAERDDKIREIRASTTMKEDEKRDAEAKVMADAQDEINKVNSNAENEISEATAKGMVEVDKIILEADQEARSDSQEATERDETLPRAPAWQAPTRWQGWISGSLGSTENVNDAVNLLNDWFDWGENVSSWTRDVDKFFAENYLGVDYWMSEICEEKINKRGEGALYADDPTGLAHLAAHIQGMKGPLLPYLLNNETNQTDPLPTENMRLYTVSWGVTPSRVTYAPEEISYSVYLGNKLINSSSVERGKSTTGRYTEYLQQDYTNACIRFDQDPGFIGGQREVCNVLIEIS